MFSVQFVVSEQWKLMTRLVCACRKEYACMWMVWLVCRLHRLWQCRHRLYTWPAGRPVCPSVHSIETTHVAQSHLLHTPLLVMLAAEAPVSCTNSAVWTLTPSASTYYIHVEENDHSLAYHCSFPLLKAFITNQNGLLLFSVSLYMFVRKLSTEKSFDLDIWHYLDQVCRSRS